MRSIIVILILSVSILSGRAQYSFVFLNARTDKAALPKEEVDKIMDGHMKNMARLAKENKLLVAGPFDGGGGIFVLNTTSGDEANAWLETDPGIQANRWRVEVLPYQPRVGSICPVKEPYEMVTYTFVRFLPNIHKENVGDYPALLTKHEAYIEKLAEVGNLVTEGTFGAQDGGILVMKGDVQPEVMENDPAIKGGTMLFEIKKLWIAKGSFCEK
jgi:uncharacterized protein YciI